MRAWSLVGRWGRPLVMIWAGAGALAGFAAPARAASCSFVTAPSSAPALCATFDRPRSSPTRSGQLDGVLWGVSRGTSATNLRRGLLYNWAAARRDTCGRTQVVAPEQDVAVCGGQAVEAVNDNGGVTDLAMYPRQPFDFAGRTGTVAFDVSDDTQGPHAAWPAFLITDQPVPAPYAQAQGLADHAHASVGFTLAAVCQQLSCAGLNAPPGFGVTSTTCVGVDSVFMTSDYAMRYVPFTVDGCVKPSPGVGSDNHFEVQVSAGGLHIYGSDPGAPSSTRLIADASFNVPLTRGLIWLEDVHFDAGRLNQQQNHTFSWGPLAFDGPVLPRDLGFDVLDNTRPGPRSLNGLPTTNLGYLVPHRRPLRLLIHRVSTLRRAAGALLELTYWPLHRQALLYSLNGHRRLRLAWPFGKQQTFVSQTVAMPVPVSELRRGTNVLRLWTSDRAGVAVANLDLILRGAGGIHRP